MAQTLIHNRTDRADLLDELTDKVLSLRNSAQWARYLDVQSRFHRYSPRNVMLISMQQPDATHVAGFKTWQRVGRHVRKGERGISILAPMLQPADEDGAARLTGFRWVTVFDVSQTTGDDLPSPVRLLTGHEPAGLLDRLGVVARSLGLEVTTDSLPAGVNGELRWTSSTVVLSDLAEPLQATKTLCHELAHFLLHRHEVDRSRAEIEAESTAYVVLGALGVDTGAYSAGYVASWLGDNSDVTGEIERSTTAIWQAAGSILERLDPDL